MIINDPVIIKKALGMRQCGMFVRNISKKLTEETGQKITQMALWRAFEHLQQDTPRELTELDYPSRREMENLFSELLAKEDKRICIHEGQQLKRNVMIEIITKFHKTEFTSIDVKRQLYTTVSGAVFDAHWDYLLSEHYIEKVNDLEYYTKTEDKFKAKGDIYKFKFSEKVKRWYLFDEV